MQALQSADIDWLLPSIDAYIDMFVARAAKGGKRWDNFMEREVAKKTLYQAIAGEHPYIQAWMSDSGTHLFLGAVSPVWWSSRPWLMEQMFCRVRQGEPGKLWAELDTLGRSLGCSTIVFGTGLASSDAALGRILTRVGYAQESTQYVKEL